jgi:gamma-glutamyltranspeptidase/glutathione hydrolase
MLMARTNVAATEHPLASTAGLHEFERGGNAFDAAAAASFALAVVQPHLNGLGGDFFGLLYSAKERTVHCLNSSGWSPSSLTVEAMKATGHRNAPEYGHGSVVIPGYVRGVCEMQRRFGRLEFSGTLQDAIGLAEKGFPAGAGLVRTLSSASGSLSSGAKRTFFRSDGTVIPVGGLIRQKELAACLREIARDGPDGFYHGTAAEAIRAEMSKGGVHVDEEDLGSYAPEWCQPLEADYKGTVVFEVPPNSMGATTLLILRLLQEEKMAGRDVKPNSAERIKRTVAAARVAYAARDAQLGDPRFMKGGFDLEEFLRAGGAGAQRKRRINDGDTTYFAVADGEGNLLSCIQSLFYGLGSRVYVEKCGFFLNNRGSSFKLGGGGPNVLEPRKRPLHTLSSLILSRDDQPFVAVGASGGDYRPQQHALFVTNIVDYSMDLERAIEYPRFLWDGGDRVRVEDGYTGLAGLKMRKVELGYPGPTGVAQGVERMAECVKGVCDARGEGLPAGC